MRPKNYITGVVFGLKSHNINSDQINGRVPRSTTYVAFSKHSKINPIS